MIFSKLGETYQAAADSLISGSIASIISAMTPVITTGIIIYFMITGYMVIAGRIQEPIGDVMIKAFKLILVATVFTQAGSIAVNAVNGIEGMFVNAITGGSGMTVYDVLDDNLNKGADAVSSIVAVIAETEEESSLFPPFGTLLSLTLTMIIVALSSILITVLAGAIYIMTKMALAVVLALSPFFIAGLFFPVTARWFDSWLSQAINYAITGAIIAFFSTFAFANFSNIITLIITEINNDVSFPALPIIELLVYAIACFFAMKQAPSIASGLAGGIGVSGVSLVGMAVAAKQAALYGMAPFKPARAAFQNTTKTDHVSGRNMTASRLQHLREGRTMLNKEYRSAMAERMRNGWKGQTQNTARKKK